MNGKNAEPETTAAKLVRNFGTISSADLPSVGGKNASLGEMIGSLKRKEIQVPDGFATTSDAYWLFIEENELKEPIEKSLEKLKTGKRALEKTGAEIRRLIENGKFPCDLEEEIRSAYQKLCQDSGKRSVPVAVRSSATAEDLPESSFAGQLESFLNVRGAENVLKACKRCYASLFTDRAISYREKKGYDHMEVALSVGVQEMVGSEKGSAGVLFTLDMETGFPDLVVISANFGLGESVVSGSVDPDEYEVYTPLLDKRKVPIVQKKLGSKQKKCVYSKSARKPTKMISTSDRERNSFVLSDEEIMTLAKWGKIIEWHYNRPMDVEWAKDGKSGELFIVQARPETVQSQKKGKTLTTYKLKGNGKKLLEGTAVGDAIASGKAIIVNSLTEAGKFEEGAVLVTRTTDPDWGPLMKKACAIVTDHGGRTSHAAIVSRELGVPAVVGCGHATRALRDNQDITISCAEGDTGYVYQGTLEFETREIDTRNIPETITNVMLISSSPDAAFRWWGLPAGGVGLARMEFIISGSIKIHPMALVHFDQVTDEKDRERIKQLTAGYEDKVEYFVDTLSRGLAKMAAAHYPNDVIVRLSDFKSNEYAELIGGREFEPHEENPMLGFRGASRYYNDRYKEAFALECAALVRARDVLGMRNIIIMVPFCRTPEEADRVLAVMEENGLRRGHSGLKIYMMAEIPSNYILAAEFALRFDGFSIGSNDLTQLVLGIDRDSELLVDLFDERNEAIKRTISKFLDIAHRSGVKVGICGQAPSDHPDFAQFLVQEGIDSISVNPASVLDVKKSVAKAEAKSAKNH